MAPTTSAWSTSTRRPLPLTLGTQVSGVLQPADQDAVYSFQANANDTFFFNAICQQRRGHLAADRAGRPASMAAPAGFSDASVLLPIAGTWTVLIEARATDSARFTYAFTPIISPTVTAPLTLGATVTGAIATPQRNRRLHLHARRRRPSSCSTA